MLPQLSFSNAHVVLRFQRAYFAVQPTTTMSKNSLTVAKINNLFGISKKILSLFCAIAHHVLPLLFLLPHSLALLVSI